MPKRVLLLLLWILVQPAWGDKLSTQQLSEVGSRSHLLCASALVYFNPQERSPDPRSLTSVFHHLNMLDTYILSLDKPPTLTQPLAAIKRVFAELDGLSRAQRERYPDLLLQLLGHHQQLQQAALDAYVQQAVLSTDSASLFHAQSQALASLLLDYQVRHYPFADRRELTLSPTKLASLSKSIEQGFDSLLSEHPGHAAVLDKVRAQYRFVRPQLLQTKSRPHSGVEFYLTRAVIDLDELATMLLQTQS